MKFQSDYYSKAYCCAAQVERAERKRHGKKDYFASAGGYPRGILCSHTSPGQY